ncbi:MAG: chromosome partitioning protein ParB, partial [Flavonifractor plautii]|nr:chromosome partitioning protein ParB [Flavonifractor plautii]MDU6292565.1 chromosome partitioning protein ParB [Flavonifractor plautii]MDU6345071.1 chromosome partitioning protein ParB [Flavonifractor plautii]
MVVDKPNVGPEKNRLPAETAPPRQNDPPALKSVKSPGNPLGHEQAVISGMGEEAPAPAGKVIDLSGIKTAADHSGKEPTAPNVADRPPEVVPDQKRRGRPPKEQAGVSAGKKEKAAEPRTGRPSK